MKQCQKVTFQYTVQLMLFIFVNCQECIYYYILSLMLRDVANVFATSFT